MTTRGIGSCCLLACCRKRRKRHRLRQGDSKGNRDDMDLERGCTKRRFRELLYIVGGRDRRQVVSKCPPVDQVSSFVDRHSPIDTRQRGSVVDERRTSKYALRFEFDGDESSESN